MMFLFLLFATFGAGFICDRDHILDCMFIHLDSNNNGLIEASEINHFMVTQPCGVLSAIISGESFLYHCDTNGDGVFNAIDYDAELSCFQSYGVQRTVCQQCEVCEEGVLPPSR